MGAEENFKFTVFEKGGPEHTEATLKIAKENADKAGIKKIVIASTGGNTIKKAIEIFDPSVYELICVTHNYGFKEGIAQEFPDDLRKDLEAKGVKVLSTVLAFSGVQTGINKAYGAWDITGLFARLVRSIIGDGVKVCMECVLMATDSGLVGLGEDVIAVAGTGRGADTCALIRSASTRALDKLKVKAIFCKPYVARE